MSTAGREQKVVRGRKFTITVAAIAKFAEERKELYAHGADEVLHLYTGAGAAPADAAMGETSILRTIRQEGRLPVDEPPPEAPAPDTPAAAGGGSAADGPTVPGMGDDRPEGGLDPGRTRA